LEVNILGNVRDINIRNEKQNLNFEIIIL